MPKTELGKRAYEFVKARGCATTREIAEFLGVSVSKAYVLIRGLYAKRLVLPYRPHITRERVFCVPDVGDKLYGRERRIDGTGLICITLPVSLIEIIDEIAMKTGETRSGLIRQAVEQLIGNYFGEDVRHRLSELSHDGEELPLIVPDR